MERRISEGKKDQEPYVLPVSQESEEFIDDDTVPSLFLEDIGGDKEVWILECPLTVDPTKLLGKQLHFGHSSSITADEVTKESIIASPIKEEGVVCCLLSSCSGDTISPVGLQYAGKLKLDLSCDVPCSESMIPDDGSVPLPVGLKSRHPFLGPEYQNIVENIKNSEKNIFRVKNENVDQDIPVKKKKKKKSTNTGYEEIVAEEKDTVDEPVEGYVTHRKKKKHALPCQDETPEVANMPFDGLKVKKEKVHPSPIKNHDLSQSLAAWTDADSQFSKRVKKEKNISLVQNISTEEFCQPIGKKKKHSRNTDSDVTSEDVVEELAVIGGVHVSKKAKKRKSEIPVILVEPSVEKPNEIQEIKIEDVKPSKKKRKRHTMDNADIQYAPILVDGETEHIVEENNVIPSKKKKKMDSIPEDEFVLLSPKEKLMDFSGKIKQKIKKEKRKSCIPELL